MEKIHATFLLSLAICGCGAPDLGPLSQYGDVWQGQITLTGGSALPLEVSLVTNEQEEWLAQERNESYKTLFAEMKAGDWLLAGRAQAGHTDNSQVGGIKEAKPGREFVTVYIAPTLPGVDQQQPLVAAYASRHQGFALALGMKDPQVRLAAERNGEKIEGLVLGYPADGVARTIGTFSLTKSGPAAAQRLSPDVVASEHFKFTTVLYNNVQRWIIEPQ